jgi:hypothetical protein
MRAEKVGNVFSERRLAQTPYNHRVRQWRRTRWRGVAVAWSAVVAISCRRRKCVSAVWTALLESPVASAMVRTLALMWRHLFRVACP